MLGMTTVRNRDVGRPGHPTQFAAHANSTPEAHLPAPDDDPIVGWVSVKDLGNALELDHYLVAAYDSIEDWQKKIVVVAPHLDGPAWVGRTRRRSPKRGARLALAVPSLDHLTLRMAQMHTNILTDYTVVREWPQEDRRRGVMTRGGAVAKDFTQVDAR